jgi:hypothetical protein
LQGLAALQRLRVQRQLRPTALTAGEGQRTGVSSDQLVDEVEHAVAAVAAQALGATIDWTEAKALSRSSLTMT